MNLESNFVQTTSDGGINLICESLYFTLFVKKLYSWVTSHLNLVVILIAFKFSMVEMQFQFGFLRVDNIL